ncbi:MAG: S-layer homology domain-containing protein, partial [Lachnospiraceae bacterium]|nr:S-layer homology domain-containing protein [Lachnospiraceae bacterium]
MKKTRFFGLLLAAVMALGVFLAPSAPVLAEEAPVLEPAEDQLVNVVDISIRQPEIGESYNYNYPWDYTINDADPHYYVESILWLNEGGQIPESFQYGTYYYCDIMVAPAIGYRLGEGTSCLLNGFTAPSVSYMEGNRISLRSSYMGPCMAAPEIMVVNNAANNDAVLEWWSVDETDYYMCWIREYPNGSWTSLTPYPGERRCRATGLTPGVQYQFGVAAYNYTYGLGNISESGPFTYVGQPGGVTVSASSTGTTVSWGPASGAAGYEFCYGGKGNDVWDASISVTGTTNTVGPRTFRGGQNYEITVFGVAEDGTWSAPSGALFMGRFSDVTDESLFYFNPVYWAAQKNITTGYDDNTFRPLNGCNRAAVVTFLWRMAGCPEPMHMAAFSDMTGNEDFDKAISWASENGITTGYADNTFRPWATCNRAAVVTFLWRYAGKPAVSGAFPFSDSTGNPDFDTAIQWAVQNGITTGW